MDIRIINRKGELMNVSRLNLKVIGSNLIGINEEEKVVNVETYESEEKARGILEEIVTFIWRKHLDADGAPIIINLNEKYTEKFKNEGRKR